MDACIFGSLLSCGHTYTPCLLASLVSRVITLTVPYDYYMLYAYERTQDEELAEEHFPPSSRLLLSASQPTEPHQDMRPEYATRLAPRRTIPLTRRKPMRKFEPGFYTVTDVLWRMALDLSSTDKWSPISFGSYGWGQQQVSMRLAYFDFRAWPQNPEVGEPSSNLRGQTRRRRRKRAQSSFSFAHQLPTLLPGAPQHTTAGP